MATFQGFISIWILFITVSKGEGGPYPASFDCPMRQLALEFAQNIQPFLSFDQLQEIADALKGSPEASNCSVSPNDLPFEPPHQQRMAAKWNKNDDIPSLYVSPTHGKDDVNSPTFKSLQFALNYARTHFGPHKWKKIILMKGVHYLKETVHLSSDDSNLILSNFDNEESVISGAVLLKNLNWKLYKNLNPNSNKNIFYTKVDAKLNDDILDIPGLRVNGKRAIRARYPNANPLNGFGSNLTTTQWLPPTTYNPQPGSWFYPSYPYRNMSVNGLFQHYNLGIGGYCKDYFDPPAGYWCSPFVQGGMAATYRVPTGLVFNATQLPNAPYYSNVSDGAIIHVWRPGHWATWMFEVSEYDQAKNEFKFGRGGFQGARGNDVGAEYYVENIFEELDAENEFFYNSSSGYLYYYNNVSNASNNLQNLVFEATKLKVLFNLTGNQSNPIKNVIFRGLTFKDSAISFMEAHCMPSGGDWALQRIGAITLTGTENVSISNNLFSRLDGIAISINSYNRNVSVIQNEFVYNGETVIAAMGDTQGIQFPESQSFPQTEFGYDGTNGNQPRFLNISLNFVHEIGIWEKQSSFFFQAKSCQNFIGFNIFFNGPRAGININDGFGGNTNITKNLLFNTCRESGDHGPINTWDRQVYVTKVRDGVTPSVIKAFDYIFGNFLLSNYDAIWSVDNDDSSSYYSIFENFQVYGTGGLKTIWGGHDIRHFDNIFAYVQQQCFKASIQDQQLTGYNDWYFGNVCVLNDAVITNQEYGFFAPCNVSNKDQWPILGNNTVYLMNETEVDYVGLCGMNQKEFQTKYDYDIGTVIYGPNKLNDSKIINMARAMLMQ